MEAWPLAGPLCLDWTNNLVQARTSDGTIQVVTNTALSTVADGTWRHVFVVEDRGAANTQYLYVDGVLKDSDPLSAMTKEGEKSTSHPRHISSLPILILRCHHFIGRARDMK